jgi:pimeloyl-ACP methyl ester carboxylesterase
MVKEALKMQTIILPGFSVTNKDWAYEVQTKLGADAVVHEWKHWKTGDDSDFVDEEEIAQILEKIDNQKVNILAKSIGTFIAVRLLERKLIEKLILCGIPLGFLKKNSLHLEAYQSLADFPASKVICFQNAQDTAGTYQEIEKFIHEINPSITIVSKPRSDHHYPYFVDFKQFLG